MEIRALNTGTSRAHGSPVRQACPGGKTHPDLWSAIHPLTFPARGRSMIVLLSLGHWKEPPTRTSSRRMFQVHNIRLAPKDAPVRVRNSFFRSASHTTTQHKKSTCTMVISQFQPTQNCRSPSDIRSWVQSVGQADGPNHTFEDLSCFPAAFQTRLAPSFIMVSSFWWFYIIIIIATYGANLIAFFSIDTYTAPFQTLEQLAEHPDYKLGTVGATALMDEMKVSFLGHQLSTRGTLILRIVQASKLPFHCHQTKTCLDKGSLPKSWIHH